MDRFTHVLRFLVVGLALLSVVALLGVGCSAAAPKASTASPAAPSAAPKAAAPKASASPAGAASSDQPPIDRMIVRDVALSLAVSDVDAAVAEITRVADGLGGFVVSADSRESDGKRVAKIAVRVPSGKLDEAVGHIKGLAEQVRRETNAAKDVTEEYVDQDARLRNLRAAESQYLQVLSTAKTIDEIMTVRKVLSEVRDQIERTEGRLQFLRRSAEMATVSVDLDTVAAAQGLQVAEWSLVAVARQAFQALANIGLALATLVIWIVIFAPLWGPIALLFWWARRRQAQGRGAPPTSRPAGPPV